MKEKFFEKAVKSLRKLDPMSPERIFCERAEKDTTLRWMLDNLGKYFSKAELEEEGLLDEHKSTYTTNDPYENWGPGEYSMYDMGEIRYVFKVEDEDHNRLYRIVDMEEANNYCKGIEKE